MKDAMKTATQLFTKYWRPLTLFKRDRDFYARHAAGDVSSRDIIEIEYGGAMPRGWNVKDKPYQHTPVKITTPLTDSRSSWLSRILMSVMTLGYVRPDETPPHDIMPKTKAPGTPTLALNKLIFSPLGQGGLLYLGYGLATGLGTLLLAASPLAIIRRYPLLAITAISSLRNQPLTQILTLPFRPAMDTVGHENIHVLQNRDPYETKTGYNIFRNSFKNRFNAAASGQTLRSADAFASLGLASYFRNDYEIQARMNTLLTHQYPKWGRMPETRHELWAALIDAGLRAPVSVHLALAESDENLSDFQKSGAAARIAKQLFSPHIAELNTAYWGLYSAESREHYWHQALPYMYGHLTELCGDDRGLAKMGYTGPVSPNGLPAPIDPDARQKFWSEMKKDRASMDFAMAVKDIEAQRGMILRDHFADKMMNDEMQAIERNSPHVIALRKKMRGGSGYTDPRAP